MALIYYGCEGSNKETRAENYLREVHNDTSKGRLFQEKVVISKNNEFIFFYTLYSTFLEIHPTHHNNNDKLIFISFMKRIIQMKNFTTGYHTFFIRGLERCTTRALSALSSVLRRAKNVWVVGTTSQPCRVIRSLGYIVSCVRCPQEIDLCWERIERIKDIGDPLGNLCNKIIDKLKKKSDAVDAHIFVRECVYRLSLVYQPVNTGIIIQKMHSVMMERFRKSGYTGQIGNLCQYACEADRSICEANRDFYHLELFLLRVCAIYYDSPNGTL